MNQLETRSTNSAEELISTPTPGASGFPSHVPSLSSPLTSDPSSVSMVVTPAPSTPSQEKLGDFVVTIDDCYEDTAAFDRDYPSSEGSVGALRDQLVQIADKILLLQSREQALIDKIKRLESEAESRSAWRVTLESIFGLDVDKDMVVPLCDMFIEEKFLSTFDIVGLDTVTIRAMLSLHGLNHSFAFAKRISELLNQFLSNKDN